MPMYYIKLWHTENSTYILFFGSAHERLNGIFFLINAHGVLRQVGAVMVIHGNSDKNLGQF